MIKLLSVVDPSKNDVAPIIVDHFNNHKKCHILEICYYTYLVDKEREYDPIKMKQFVLSKLGNVYVLDEIKVIVETLNWIPLCHPH